MGVDRNCGLWFSDVWEIGQTARLLSRFLADFIREEGGYE